MASDEHVEKLKKGVDAWNKWRSENLDVRPDLDLDLYRADLSRADLYRADLSGADLYRADLSGANLYRADLSGATLSEANLSGAKLVEANLHRAKLNGANLSEAQLVTADLSEANLSGADLAAAHFIMASLIRANLREANLFGASFIRANLSEANLSGASLMRASLFQADLSGVDLTGADLRHASLAETNFTAADLTGCRIYGVSAWNLTLEGTKQHNLIITPSNEPEITVDDIEVAQFLYLLLHNEKLQGVIDTITTKVVLILGRFSLPERKEVLDALRSELRKPGRDYVPVVFDFEKPRSQTTINTVTLLARMARFVIADVSDAKSVLMELQAIVPNSPKLPVKPIIVAAQEEPGMFDSFQAYPWFLRVHPYETPAQLLADLDERVIAAVETEVVRLRT